MCLRAKRLAWYLAQHEIDAETSDAVYLALDHLPDRVLQTIDEAIIDEMEYAGIDIFTFKREAQ